MHNRSASDKPACTQRYAELTYADLPLSCPPRDEAVWDAHPRVYLPIADEGKVVCPYCSTEYILIDFKPKEIT